MDPNLEEVGFVSKSQKKRDALALQDLGRKMIELKPEILRGLPLSEDILKALIAAKPMKMGARKRQIQFIGKLLRQEEDLTALLQAVAFYCKR